MSMTQASSEYFEKIAGQWDTIRAGYFTEAVRETAIAKAYLSQDMTVADVGAGTGFMAAGLAPLVEKVYVIDGSSAMLEVARKNLREFTNIVYQTGESLAIPLPDSSLDAVFANMYLHHCVDPLGAIREMARLLKTGGRLVITDMDAHPYAWLKEDMTDVWQGFDRPQVRDWFVQAGLVNLIVNRTGQSCCAESETLTVTDPQSRQAQISIFVGVGTKPVPGVVKAVQEGYTATVEGRGGCCSTGQQTGDDPSSCCGGPTSQEDVNFVGGYSESEQTEVPADAAEISLGCGNPIALANLKPGEVVVDIGSGGGMDSFLAARRVGEAGKVIGVDMTPAMLERARATAVKNGYRQVEFREGLAEALPVDDGSVDVILSNCVINLTADKGKVFGEAFRVLREGGRLEVSDMVTDRSFPIALRTDPTQWAGCVSGALPEQEYLDLIAQAGFKDIRVRRSASAGETSGVLVYFLLVSARKGSGQTGRFEILEDQRTSSSCGCGSGCCG